MALNKHKWIVYNKNCDRYAIGVQQTQLECEVDMNTVICKGLTLQGIYGRKMDNWHQMSYMVQGGLDLTPVITHRFHYTDFEKGFAAMNSGKSGKVILDWTK